MKKRIVVLLMLVLTMICIPTFALEKADNGFIANDEVKQEKDLNTTSFIAGNNVEVTSNIDGLGFIAGNNVSISSSQDHLFAAGNVVTLDKAKTEDAFVAGSNVTIKNSEIRDLYVAAATIRIDSNISRNVYAGGDQVTINSVIGGNVKLAAEDIRIGEDAVIEGKLIYPEEAKISIAEGATVGEKETYVGDSGVTVEITTRDIITNFIMSYLSLLVVAMILLAVFKKYFKFLKKEEKDPGVLFKNIAIGFGVLVGLPIASIFVMITIIGMPLALIALALYIILIYLSAIPTAFYVGDWIMKDKKVNDYLLLACSLLVLQVLKVVPIIGGIVGFASLTFGLGMFTSFIIKSAKEDKK